MDQHMRHVRARTLGTGLAAVFLTATAALTGAGSAAADTRPAPEPGTARLAEVCGFYPVGMYRHCDNGSGSTVMLDVRDIFWGIHHVCVGPGVTNLQPGIRWRVIGAWWNGGVGCAPGLYDT
ncbi:hypothetical protein FNH05_13660 [Amycolatopsis rhizosphaerae]|uniref:Secreted protein n=1 Tax=Amycolatopsis rhizosphaerae TaxID=2053003 RepID=A0A558CTD7_9PSEU|nr:DUF6355 family natural product biosynthesis protein [Amycolatopsis rhizosphaerae]TVT52016.1 hypothetical protein FNH05_13660 [Amycolatopsis rhizosphaerae]